MNGSSTPNGIEAREELNGMATSETRTEFTNTAADVRYAKVVTDMKTLPERVQPSRKATS